MKKEYKIIALLIANIIIIYAVFLFDTRVVSVFIDYEQFNQLFIFIFLILAIIISIPFLYLTWRNIK